MKDKKSSSESLKLTVSLFEDSNVPKTDVVCSVIAAETESLEYRTIGVKNTFLSELGSLKKVL